MYLFSTLDTYFVTLGQKHGSCGYVIALVGGHPDVHDVRKRGKDLIHVSYNRIAHFVVSSIQNKFNNWVSRPINYPRKRNVKATKKIRI